MVHMYNPCSRGAKKSKEYAHIILIFGSASFSRTFCKGVYKGGSEAAWPSSKVPNVLSNDPIFKI